MALVVLKSEWGADIVVLNGWCLTKSKRNVSVNGIDGPEEEDLWHEKS